VVQAAQQAWAVARVAKGSKVEGVEKARKGATVLQSGGHTLSNRTLKGLGLSSEQAKDAIESLKADTKLPSNFHGQIMSNGDLIHPHTKEIIGNLFNYIN
jgi:hypothetical protein